MKRFVSGAAALVAAGCAASAQAADLYGSQPRYTVRQPLHASSWARPYLSARPYLGAAFGFDASWSAEVEYLYVDLSSSNFTITGVANGSQFGLLRAGVNYRF